MSELKPSTFSTKDSKFILKSFENTKTNQIIITEDKLKVILYEHKEYLYDKTSFIAPLSIIISIILTFSTASFNNATLGIQANVWQAFFMMAFFLSFLWLVYTFYKLYNAKGKNIVSLIETIKDTINKT